MGQNEINKIEELLQIPRYLSLSEFEEYILHCLQKKADSKMAIEELDRKIAILHNHISSLSLYLKQNHLLGKHINFALYDNGEYYTKQEIAIKYRVSLRTVTNWIIDGLETIEIGGVQRISNAALKDFVKIKKTKSFHWRSIAHKQR